MDTRPTTPSETATSTLLTITEAADMLRCHERTVRRLVNSGDLTAYKVANRLLFEADDLRAHVRDNRVAWR